MGKAYNGNAVAAIGRYLRVGDVKTMSKAREWSIDQTGSFLRTIRFLPIFLWSKLLKRDECKYGLFGRSDQVMPQEFAVGVKFYGISAPEIPCLENRI